MRHHSQRRFPEIPPACFQRLPAGIMLLLSSRFLKKPLRAGTITLRSSLMQTAHSIRPITKSIYRRTRVSLKKDTFKETRVLRYMDFVIGRMECAVCINDDRSVIVPALNGFFKNRDDNNNIIPAGNL